MTKLAGWVLVLALAAPGVAAIESPIATASSGDASRVAAAGGAAPWRSEAGGGQWLALDLGARRAIGGLVLDWLPGEGATSYLVEASDDGQQWRALREVTRGNAGTDWLRLPGTEARHLRLALRAGEGARYGLARLVVRDPAFAIPEAFLEAMAVREPASHFPRFAQAQRTHAMPVGLAGTAARAWMSEDGALEAAGGAFTLQPFVLDAAGCDTPQLSGWADVASKASLAEGYLPVPAVEWTRTGSGCDGQGAWTLTIDAFAGGPADAPRAIARYTLRNTASAPRDLTLALAVQPFGARAGLRPIASLSMTGGRARIDGRDIAQAIDAPAAAFASPFDSGMAPSHLARGKAPASASAEDIDGFASGAWTWGASLAAGESRQWQVELPLAAARGDALDPAAAEALRGDTLAGWHAALDELGVRVPATQGDLRPAMRAALALVLLGHASDAPEAAGEFALRGEALLRAGRHTEALALLERPTGDGPGDAGRFLVLASEAVRYTANLALADSLWPRVQAAATRLDAWRARVATLPADEDTAWAFAGYAAAHALAQIRGRADDAAWLARGRDAVRVHLAGADDAAVLARVLSPGNGLDWPRERLEAAFEPAWEAFAARENDDGGWAPYSAREALHAGAFARLGWAERANRATGVLLAARQPPGWPLVPDPVDRRVRDPAPRPAGDAADLAADFLRAAFDAFAYEDTRRRALVLAAGLPRSWFDGEGAGIAGLHTPYGVLDYHLRRDGDRVRLRIADGVRVPSGGLVVTWPLERPPRLPRKLAGTLEWSAGELRVRRLPIDDVVLDLARGGESR